MRQYLKTAHDGEDVERWLKRILWHMENLIPYDTAHRNRYRYYYSGCCFVIQHGKTPEADRSLITVFEPRRNR